MNSISKYDLAKYEGKEVLQNETSNFASSFKVLSREKRLAIESLYSFCSYIDDIVDEENSESVNAESKLSRLAFWSDAIEKMYSAGLDCPELKHFEEMSRQFNIPKEYYLTLINGCKRDLQQNRYETIDDLLQYCYGVASIVGLISIEIFGYRDLKIKEYAVNLGYAMQLTNIIRDVKADKERNFIYLPLADLYAFGLNENDIMKENYNEKFINLMKFQTERAKQYYAKAEELLPKKEIRTLFPAEIMGEVYYRILLKIEKNNYNVFREKTKLTKPQKLLIALKHWIASL